MRRKLFIGLVAFLAGVALPSLALVVPACAGDCADDIADSGCLPGCDDCACCPLVRVTLPAVAWPAPLEGANRLADEALRVPIAPAPADILHVPKPALV